MTRRRLGTRRALGGSGPSWPFGKDGPLVLHTGDILALSPGDVRDYSSINIEAGAILQVNGITGTPVVIGCAGDCHIDGEIDFFNNPVDGTFTATAPDGYVLTYTVAVAQGGAGGFCFGSGALVGEPVAGNGGGGAGVTSGGDAFFGGGGDGGDVYDSGSSFPGGSGSLDINNPDGSAGPDANSIIGNAVGGGGGGGFHGFNGGGIYMKIKGNSTGFGMVSVEGFAGGSGGSGGGGFATPGTGSGAYGGGGGGGGGAGSGGRLVIQYHGTIPPWDLVVVGGPGGTGGSGGDAGGGDIENLNGLPGDDGVVGTTGTATLIHF